MKIYLRNDDLIIRSMKKSDISKIIYALNDQGWISHQAKFESYYEQQKQGLKFVFIAEKNSEVLGYVTLDAKASYGPFKNHNVPMIIDLNVFKIYQQKGVGSCLMDACERVAFSLSNQVCLGVGLHHGYGNAQRLYIKRGYVPDGTGVWYHDHIATPYQIVENNDDLNLFLVKNKVGLN